MSTLISNIKTAVNVAEGHVCLRGKHLSKLSCINNSYIIIEGEHIAEVGQMDNLIHSHSSFTENYNAEGCFVMPSWCDSHTHLVFTGSRENEFVDKINGLTYADIAAKGGGILNSAKLLNETSEEEIYTQSFARLQQVIKMGTGAIEIKSGYGLTLEGELKMLRIIKRLKENTDVLIKSTFLGAHALPAIYKNNKEGYIKLIIEEMLPAIAAENLADYIDVFCEANFYTPAETERICRAGMQYGLKPKIHANQLSISGGVEAGVNVGAISVDHLESMDDHAIRVLAKSNTIGTLLPTAAFFLRMPFQPARKLIDAGCAIALASDYNPGSSPSGNMNLVLAMSCIQMKMLPEEAINAATYNGACAMEIQSNHGSISPGKKANLIFTKPVASLAYLPYSFGSNSISRVMVNGSFI